MSRPIDRTEWVPIVEAAGRVAAVDVAASIDVPPFSRSAMDGYAVRRGRHRGRLEADAGAPANRRANLHRADAVRTGRRRRVARRSRPARRCRTAPTPWSWSKRPPAPAMTRSTCSVRSRPVSTSDAVAATSPLATWWCAASIMLNPSRIGALAAVGTTEVEVYVRPRVAILSTGNEVMRAGKPSGARPDLRRQPLHA